MSLIQFSGRFHKMVILISKMKIPAAALLLGLFIAGCDHILEADSQEQLITAQVHLQEGFQRHHVSVSCDDAVHLEAFLSSKVPLTGPLAVFRLDVPSGIHQLQVCWVPFNGNREVGLSEADIELQPAESYYVGLTLSDDSLHVSVQKDPFLYL